MPPEAVWNPSPQTGLRVVQLPVHVAVPGGSQSSTPPLLTTPSPQTSSTQPDVQPSPLTVLPSSHCSGAVRNPSPHTGVRVLQVPVQVAVLGGSQSSAPSLLTTPSPQSSSTHPAVQPSPFAVFPSSHCSGGVWNPSPHTGLRVVQLPVQVAVPGGSQSSAPASFTRPSPQNSSTQPDVQPSPFAVFPSSHCSGGVWKPSPQTGGRSLQVAVHSAVFGARSPQLRRC